MKSAGIAAFVVAATIGSAIASQAALAETKTRDQVHAELLRAQHDGFAPVNKTQYPPSADAVARQKKLHAISKHAGETSPDLDHHDRIASR
jgi:hypothetical protein